MMNLMKKLSALALAMAMTASLAACGGGSDDASGNSGDGEAVKYLIGISQYGPARVPGQLPGGLSSRAWSRPA